jgi:hypothetical protein
MNPVITPLLLLTALASVSFGQAPALWQDPSPHSIRFVTVDDGVQLEVLDWGGKGRAVVLLAGSATRPTSSMSLHGS